MGKETVKQGSQKRHNIRETFSAKRKSSKTPEKSKVKKISKTETKTQKIILFIECTVSDTKIYYLIYNGWCV